MALGRLYSEPAGHSQGSVTPGQSDSMNGPNTENNGYHAQPASTGSQWLDTDGESLVPHDVQRPIFTIYEGHLPNNVLCPPSLRPTAGAPLEHCQSASGFSDDRMNMPPDEHLRQLESTSMSVRAELEEQDRDTAHVEDTTAILLEYMLARERDQDIAAVYRRTVQQLKESNISEDVIIDVVIQNGIPCLTSRGSFFEKHDKDDDLPSVSSTQRSLTNLEHMRLATPSLDSGSAMTTNVTPGRHAVPRYQQYEDSNSRLHTYISWQCVFQTKEELCAAGLFYTGKEDICRCFDCGVSIMKWKPGDIPIVEHIRLRPNCQFAQQLCRQTHRTAFEARPDQSRRDTLENSHRICQVCGTNEVSVSQFRCGHVVCPKCVPAKPPNGEKRYCQIRWCGREIEDTSAYDRAAL